MKEAYIIYFPLVPTDLFASDAVKASGWKSYLFLKADG